MAGNMDPNDLQGVANAMEELRRTGTLTAESLAKLNGSTKESAEAQQKFANGLLQYSRQVSGAVSSLATGNGSFKSLSGSVDVTAKAISKVAGEFGTVGKIIGGLATGLGAAAKVVLGQLDFLAENYNNLGSASAGAVDGMDGLVRQFDQLGNYSLQAFTKAVKANALGLNVFKGTASAGAEELSRVAGALTQGKSAEKFIKLGISLDEVGDATSSYISNYARFGLIQGNTTEELTKKTQNYIEEVDKIARLTGQSRAQQQDEQAKTMADARSRAELSKMRKRGETDQATQLELLMKAFDATTNSAVRATATGIPLTKQAQSFNVFTNDQIRQTVIAVKSGQMTALEGTARINKALAAGAERFGNTVSFAGDIFEGAALAGFDAESRELALVELRQKAENKGLKDDEIIAKQAEKQANSSGELTKKYASASLAAADVNKNIQKLGIALAISGVGAIETFSSALKRATDVINNKFGLKPQPLGGSGGATTGAKEMIKNIFSGGGNSSGTLLDLIGKGESGGNYNALVGAKAGGSKVAKEADLTNMTIEQVQQMQKTMLAQGHASTAVGKYQMISATLAEQVKKSGLDPSKTKFDQKTQDLLAQQLVNQAGYGKKDPATVMRNLAGTWAALPKDMSGRGAYDGYNTNKSNIDPNDLMAALSGPSSSKATALSSVNPESTVKTLSTPAPSQDTSKEPAAADSMKKSFAEMTAELRRSNALAEKQLKVAKRG